jgi:hypothetical protein
MTVTFIPDWINSIEYLIYYGVIFNKFKKGCTQLAAASDKACHRGLIHKMNSYGIKGPLIKWFEHYL